MDYQLNYFFEEPVDLIKKYGSEILSLLKVDLLVLNGIKNDKVEISLEEVEKISKILESTDFEINDYFLAGNKKYLKNDTVKYFTLLLQETVLLRALESKKSTEINQFSYNKEKKSALEHINSLLCDEKISLKSIKTKVAENILLNNYSEGFLSKLLKISSFEDNTMILFKAKVENKEKVLSNLYKDIKSEDNELKIKLLDRELIINNILGKNWTPELSKIYSPNYNKYFAQFFFLELKDKNVLSKVENVLKNYVRDEQNLIDMSNNDKVSLNLLNIQVLRTICENVKDSDVCLSYMKDTIYNNIIDIKVNSHESSIYKYEKNSEVFAWSYLYSHLNNYKSLIEITMKLCDHNYKKEEDDFSNTPQHSMVEVLSFLEKETNVSSTSNYLEMGKKNVIESLSAKLDSLSSTYGNELVVKMLMNFDLKVLPKQEILREEYILNKEIPINHVSYNNKVKKF